MPEREPLSADVLRYISIGALVVIVLGTFAITWVLNDHEVAREAVAAEGSISVCGMAPSQRPTTIALACGTSAATLTGVTWSQWSDQAATGTGTYSSGDQQVQATVVLSGVTRTAAGPQFTQMTITPSGGQPLHQRIGIYAAGASNASAEVPVSGALCASPSRSSARRLGVIGKHTSCDFADQVRRAYLDAGGHGQPLQVSATSTVTHQTYKNIECSAGTYVVCVGGHGDTARVFFGPFD